MMMDPESDNAFLQSIVHWQQKSNRFEKKNKEQDVAVKTAQVEAPKLMTPKKKQVAKSKSRAPPAPSPSPSSSGSASASTSVQNKKIGAETKPISMKSNAAVADVKSVPASLVADAETKLKSNYFLLWSSQLKRFYHALEAVLAMAHDLNKHRVIRFLPTGIDIYVSNAHMGHHSVMRLDERFFGGLYVCPPDGFQICIHFPQFVNFIATMNKAKLKTIVLALTTENHLYVSNHCSQEDLQIAAKTKGVDSHMMTVIKELKEAKRVNGQLFQTVAAASSLARSVKRTIEEGAVVEFCQQQGLGKYPSIIQLPMSAFKNALPGNGGPVFKFDFQTLPDKSSAEMKFLNHQNVGTTLTIPRGQILSNPWSEKTQEPRKVFQHQARKKRKGMAFSSSSQRQQYPKKKKKLESPPPESTSSSSSSSSASSSSSSSESSESESDKNDDEGEEDEEEEEEKKPGLSDSYSFTGHFYLPAVLAAVKKPKELSKYVDLFFKPDEPLAIRCMIESPHSFWLTYFRSLKVANETDAAASSVTQITNKMIELESQPAHKKKSADELQALAIQEIAKERKKD
jgi:hypothetical protein